MSENKYVEIHQGWPGWRVALNPMGGGLILCIDRGIPCEGHTQVISYHTSNTPSMETVTKVVKELSGQLEREIDAFVDLMKVMDTDWATKDQIGILFAHHIIKTIASKAEAREDQEFFLGSPER